jgi:hypothetical protein
MLDSRLTFPLFVYRFGMIEKNFLSFSSVFSLPISETELRRRINEVKHFPVNDGFDFTGNKTPTQTHLKTAHLTSQYNLTLARYAMKANPSSAILAIMKEVLNFTSHHHSFSMHIFSVILSFQTHLTFPCRKELKLMPVPNGRLINTT